MKYFSMFSGIGGFEHGIEKAYSENRPKDCSDSLGPTSQHGGCPFCVGFSEIDKYAIAIYQKHFPTHKNYGDATRIIPEDLPDFDFLCGGFPCQAFSIAGKRGGFEDTRGTLFFDIARIVRVKRPKLLLLENVKGLLSHDSGRTFGTILATISELGYFSEWQVLNSKDFGVPQNRERVFIVGHLGRPSRGTVFPITTSAGKDIVQLNQPIHSNNRLYGDDGISPALNTMQGGNRQPKIVSPHNRRTEFKTSDISNTLTSHFRGSPDGDGKPAVLENSTIRRLTPTECERLQGYPDGWTKEGVNGPVSDSQRYKTLGNSVTTNVITAIMSRIYDKGMI